jgi:hypothetical protein
MRFYYCCLIFFAAVLLCTVSQAAVYNGDFEIALDEPLIDIHGHLFYPPEGWKRINYAAVLEQFVPDPNESDYGQWKIDTQQGLEPVEGQSFVLLTTGDINEVSELGFLRQDIYVYAGQTMSGYYFFGTLDWEEYPDWATIVMDPIDPESPLRSITLAYVSVTTVGSFSSTEGWQYFEHTFTADEEGGYHLIIRVDDYYDELYTSYFAVDGLTMCGTGLDGDINHDCLVNLRDFSWLATDWLKNCNDPNYSSDPNSNCYKGTDLNGDGPVDLNDLEIMSDNWIFP